MAKRYMIQVSDEGKISINGIYHFFDTTLDKENKEDDMNKKILVALANQMNYEAVFLFEEIADTLNDMVVEEN